jgi:hypothetical protein
MLDEVAATRVIPIRWSALGRIPDPGSCALKMHDAGSWHEPDIPAGEAGASAKINLLEVKKVSLIQSAYILKHLASDD